MQDELNSECLIVVVIRKCTIISVGMKMIYTHFDISPQLKLIFSVLE